MLRKFHEIQISLTDLPPLSTQFTEVYRFVNDFLQLEKFEELRKRLSATLLARKEIRIGSLFTGWGVCEMVMSELTRQWNELHPDIEFKAHAD